MSVYTNRTAFTFIDLFAGIGGNRLAFERVGGKCIFASEKDTLSRKIYTHNFGMLHGDFDKIDEKNIPDHDILLANIPWRTPSTAIGTRTNVELNLLHKIANILDEKKPKAFFRAGLG